MGEQMTEPTAEQTEAERELAHEIQDALVFPCLSVEHPGSPHDEDCNVLATALARVRIEAHAAGRDEGLVEAEKEAVKSSQLGRGMHMMRHWEDIRDAIRALRGRT